MLSSAVVAAHRRAVLQTDTSTLNPFTTACNATAASDLTVAIGAALAPDLLCTSGTETWNIAGTSAVYTTSASTSGSVTIDSGGYLIFQSVTEAPNPFSVGAGLTVNGAIEVVCMSCFLCPPSPPRTIEKHHLNPSIQNHRFLMDFWIALPTRDPRLRQPQSLPPPPPSCLGGPFGPRIGG